MSHISNFIEAMRADGFSPRNESDIVPNDGESVLIAECNDKGGALSLYYSLSIENDKASGRWYSCRESRGGSWYSRTGAKWSQDEKDAWKAKKEAKELERLALRDRVADECHAKFVKLPYAIEHPYLTCKGVRTHKTRISGDLLVIPALSKAWRVRTLQYINADGDKLFAKDGEKSGNFYPIGITKSDKPELIYICEGFATGGTIHEATEKPVIVAFDAGNLLPVAKNVRELWPDAQLVFCADNDESGGGFEKATQAAANVNGSVIMPETVGTDFNDNGLDYTRNRLATVRGVDSRLMVAKPREVEQVETPDYDSFTGEIFEVAERVDAKGFLGLQFKILGYHADYKLYYSFREKQLIVLNANQHTYLNLIRLANHTELLAMCGQDEKSNISDAKLMKLCNGILNDGATAQGFYDINGKVRGAGCWRENDKIVIHCGDSLLVDNKKLELYEAKGKNIYVISGTAFKPAHDSLTNFEANELRELCRKCPWENPLSGDLLAGWIVAAQVCSLLKWRPHIWVSGAHGSGKSTVLDHLIKPAVGDIAMQFTGGTTAASIRQDMNYDARPIIYDECEPDDPSMQGVLDLAKLASSGGRIGKFGQAKIEVRWSFAFASIDRKIKDLAMESRICLLRLKKPVGVDRSSEYEDFMARINKTVKSENFSGRLLKRTLNNLDVFLENVATFTKAINRTLKDSRSADQIAPMLAGCYLLCRTDKITLDDAIEWVKSRDWETHSTYNAEPDHVRLMDHLMSGMIRVNNHGDLSMGDMVEDVIKRNDEFYARILKNYGIIIKDDKMFIAVRHKNVKALLRGTQWYDSWGNTLMDYAGAEKTNNMRFSGGVSSRAVCIPLAQVIGE